MTVEELVSKSVNMRFDDTLQINKKDKIVDFTKVFNIIFDDMIVSNQEVERFYTDVSTAYHIIWIK